MKRFLGYLMVVLALGLFAWIQQETVSFADDAGSIDYHSDVRAVTAVADASSGVCLEIDASGNVAVELGDLEQAEDAAHTDADEGIMLLTVRQNSAAALSGTDADYQPLITDTNGRLHVLDANSAAIKTAVEIIDDWDDTDYCNVNANIAGTDLAADEGTHDTATQRVTIATDDEMNDALAAVQTAIEIIDDWDDSDLANVNCNIAGTDLAADEGTHDAATQRVTIATDDEMNDALAAVQTAIEIIDDWDDTDYANVNANIAGTDMAADEGTHNAQTPRVTIATDDEINDDIDAILTAVEKIDDWDDGDTASVSPDAKTGVVVATNDVVIKGSPGELFGVMVCFDGVTAGDTVEIENHATADSGTSLCMFVAQAADQVLTFTPCVAIAYAAGIYCDFTLSGGAATVTAVYE